MSSVGLLQHPVEGRSKDRGQANDLIDTEPVVTGFGLVDRLLVPLMPVLAHLSCDFALGQS
jgi:hypothetical protein